MIKQFFQTFCKFSTLPLNIQNMLKTDLKTATYLALIRDKSYKMIKS